MEVTIVKSKLFVGNVNYEAERETLEDLFRSYGALRSFVMPVDRHTGRPRGFVFVEYFQAEHAQAALELNGVLFLGRPLNVREADDRRSVAGVRWKEEDAPKTPPEDDEDEWDSIWSPWADPVAAGRQR